MNGWKVEFVNVYPSTRHNEYVFIAVIVDASGDRLMVYAPMCRLQELEMTAEGRGGGRDCWGNIMLPERRLLFGGEVFASKEGAGQENFFTIYNLDQIGKKPTISKEDIEKMFGCKIDG
jgi:hypothetical protein